MTRLLIVGAGIAAVSAAESARRTDSGMQITIAGEERYLPYYRTRLSHLLGKQATSEQLSLHPESWYAERQIELKLGARAEAIDAAAHTVSFSEGEAVGYDRLIIANGSRAFLPPVPGNDLPGVFTLRTFDDCLSITAWLRDRKRVVISGGGPLGLEAAWALRQWGKNVTVLERGDGLLRKQLDQRGAALLRQIAERNGVSVLTGAELSSIEGAIGAAEAVLNAKTSDGRMLPADAVLFSVGIRANSELAAGAGIAVSRGITVDERMRTSFGDIFAAGDVAIYGGRAFGIWPAAMEQGKVAGINAAGGDAIYAEVAPSNTVMVLGTSIFSAGEIAGDGALTLSDGDEAADSYRAAFVRDGTLVGVCLVGDTALGSKFRNAIDARRGVPAGATFAGLTAAL